MAVYRLVDKTQSGRSRFNRGERMPSFSDYLQILDRPQQPKPWALSRAIRSDKGLADWQRNALLMQIGMRARSEPPAVHEKLR